MSEEEKGKERGKEREERREKREERGGKEEASRSGQEIVRRSRRQTSASSVLGARPKRNRTRLLAAYIVASR